MTEKEALLWVLGILGSLCAAAITIDKVLDIIHKYIKKAQAPDDAQNKRMDTLEKRLGVLEQGQLQHAQALQETCAALTASMKKCVSYSLAYKIFWIHSCPATIAKVCKKANPILTTTY